MRVQQDCREAPCGRYQIYKAANGTNRLLWTPFISVTRTEAAAGFGGRKQRSVKGAERVRGRFSPQIGYHEPGGGSPPSHCSDRDTHLPPQPLPFWQVDNKSKHTTKLCQTFSLRIIKEFV